MTNVAGTFSTLLDLAKNISASFWQVDLLFLPEPELIQPELKYYKTNEYVIYYTIYISHVLPKCPSARTTVRMCACLGVAD
jgi:hypothetical protein